MNILVAIDLSSASQKILDKTKTLALALPAKVCLLHVIEDDPDFPDDEPDSQDSSDQGPQEFPQEHKVLQKEVDELRESGIDTKGMLTQVSIVDVILHKSKQLEIDIKPDNRRAHCTLAGVLLSSLNTGSISGIFCNFK